MPRRRPYYEQYDDEFEDEDEYDEYDEDEYEAYDDFWLYEPSQPIPVVDGIKAKSRKGAFGSSWWAKRWIGVLETFGYGSRLQRGKTYARQGQVVSIDLAVGRVKAKVQGSRSTPYTVSLKITPLSDGEWSRAIDAMAQQAVFAATLLNGEMPQEIEEAFTAAGVALFPTSERDIETQCSCPDYMNPCKHIAAVYYLLGERFDDDPFLIFHLRGRTRAQLIEVLRSRRAAMLGNAANQPSAEVESAPPLADLLDTFYAPGPDLASITVSIAAPEVEAGLLRQMGAAPVGIDPELRKLYAAMTAQVLHRVFGTDEG
ncbi:MAG TPA: SWIM zinc finger family protein [Herpetosiphonaceae bacterium]